MSAWVPVPERSQMPVRGLGTKTTYSSSLLIGLSNRYFTGTDEKGIQCRSWWLEISWRVCTVWPWLVAPDDAGLLEKHDPIVAKATERNARHQFSGGGEYFQRRRLRHAGRTAMVCPQVSSWRNWVPHGIGSTASTSSVMMESAMILTMVVDIVLSATLYSILNA